MDRDSSRLSTGPGQQFPQLQQSSANSFTSQPLSSSSSSWAATLMDSLRRSTGFGQQLPQSRQSSANVFTSQPWPGQQLPQSQGSSANVFTSQPLSSILSSWAATFMDSLRHSTSFGQQSLGQRSSAKTFKSQHPSSSFSSRAIRRNPNREIFPYR